MLVLRSLTLGLIAGCTVVLVAASSPVHHHVLVQLPVEAVATPSLPPPTIVDAAPGITPAQLAMTIRLAPGEQIVSVDDLPVANDVGAGIALASRELRAGRFIDLGVAGPAGERRVLVLLH